jgi:hypothetical protein
VRETIIILKDAQPMMDAALVRAFRRLSQVQIRVGRKIYTAYVRGFFGKSELYINLVATGEPIDSPRKRTR